MDDCTRPQDNAGVAHRPGFTLIELLIVVVIMSVLMYFLVRANHGGGREAARRSQCCSHLKQIGLALQAYHSEHGTLPPPDVLGSEGQPAHSWRVLILPYLDEKELYDRYNLDEPWNGPNNRQLADQMPEAYKCWTDDKDQTTFTNYLAIVGPDSA